MRAHLRSRVPVLVIVSGEKVEPVPLAYAQTGVNYKTFLGDTYSEAVNAGRVPMAPDTYVKDDHAIVIKSGGKYECTPQQDGKHGDTFDGGKLSLHALTANPGAGLFVPVPFAGGRMGRAMARRREGVAA